MSEPAIGGSRRLLPLTDAREARDAGWLRAARWARRLAWISLAWMCVEGVIGLWQGLAAGSVSLTGWALGSAVEGLASVIVVWRFTGSRMLSQTAERRAQRGVAVSFWLIAPYIAAQSVADLVTGHQAEGTAIGSR
jgi:heme A synthase